MAFDTRRTYLCYNNRDLIRDGFIPRSIRKSYREDNSLTKPVTSFNFNRLNNPPKGVFYSLKRKKDDPSVIVEVIEKKKLLPAEKVKVEIEFSKTTKNAVTHPVGPVPIAPGVGGLAGNAGMSAIGFGGFSTGFTEITYHLLESDTRINKKVEITQEIIDNGIIKFDGFPLSIFGIVREHIEEFKSDPGEDGKTDLEKAQEFKAIHPQAKIGVNEEGKVVARIGIDFKVIDGFSQLDSLGKFTQGSFLGTGRKRIDGATDKDGLFGGAANPYLVLVSNKGDSGIEDEEERNKREVILLGDQKNLFIKIVQDERTLKFRGDNKEAIGKGLYPFQIRGAMGIDATDKQIRIDTTDLVAGDFIYITFNETVGERFLRQNIDHKGVIAQGNTVGIIGFRGAIASEQDIFNYEIREWKVPPLPNSIDISTIDKITDNYVSDNDYKLTLDEFLEIDAENRERSIFNHSKASIIEGWRLSEAILWRRIRDFFAADYRGILHVKNRLDSTVLFPRSLIRDQEWFTKYLEDLPFTYPTGPVNPNDPIDEDGFPKRTYLPSDLEVNIEDGIDFRDMEGFLFDTSEIVNSLLFDREKLHYYRPFAEALKRVSKYSEDDLETGVGIPSLDLLSLLCPSIGVSERTEFIDGETVIRKNHNYRNFDYSTCDFIKLDYYDLSYADFEGTKAQFAKGRNCEESVPLRHYNYFSTNRDADSEGQGIWYDRGHILNSVFEWRPPGGTLESFWRIETPYFCGNFGSDSRVYIEKMGGNSLDNYSWIYVDTEPTIPSNISADINYDSSTSMIVFSEDSVHQGLSFYMINDNFFESRLPLKKIDETKNHIRDVYNHEVDGQDITENFDHNQNRLVGQNRILGDSPTYSHGIPITEDIFKVCNSICEPDNPDSFFFWFTKDLLNDTRDDGESFDLDFSDDPPRANLPFNWFIRYIEIEFSYRVDISDDISKYVSFYFEQSESSISELLISDISPTDNGFLVRFGLRYYYGGPMQFLGEFWKKVNIINVRARFSRGNDASLEEKFDINTYKINSSQSSISFDRQRRIFVFYANEETSNIDIATSYDEGVTWAYDRNILRLTSNETATLPFAMKDLKTSDIHLYWVLNNKYLMYKKIDSDLIDPINGLVDPIIPDSYTAGDYNLLSDDPEREYWGNFSYNGILLRREPSYFIVANAEDEYFLDQIEISRQINDFNRTLIGTSDENKIQAQRLLFNGNFSEMRDNFKGLPYSVFLSGDGVLRLFFISNSKLSIKSSYNYVSWHYDVSEQIIHRTYMDDELNEGFSNDISNIQIVRDDYDKSLVSVLYTSNEMLFIRHFYTSELFSWRDSEGNLNNNHVKKHLDITKGDLNATPPEKRTNNIPIFLVGNIPGEIKEKIKNEIDNDILLENSDLAIYFPYKDPNNPSDKDANKNMVNIFDNNFSLDTNTQPYGCITARGLIRVYYKDTLGNVDGIIIDQLEKPNLEVMNVFKGIKE